MTQTILLMLIYAHRFQVIKHSIKTSLRFVFFASPTPLPQWQVSEGEVLAVPSLPLAPDTHGTTAPTHPHPHTWRG